MDVDGAIDDQKQAVALVTGLKDHGARGHGLLRTPLHQGREFVVGEFIKEGNVLEQGEAVHW